MRVVQKHGVTFYFGADDETADRFDEVAQDVAAFPSVNARSSAASALQQPPPEEPRQTQEPF
jgi:hypothetical protein